MTDYYRLHQNSVSSDYQIQQGCTRQPVVDEEGTTIPFLEQVTHPTNIPVYDSGTKPMHTPTFLHRSGTETFLFALLSTPSSVPKSAKRQTIESITHQCEIQDVNLVIFNMTLFKHVYRTVIDFSSKMRTSLPNAFRSFPIQNRVVWKQYHQRFSHKTTTGGSLCIFDLNSLTRTSVWGEESDSRQISRGIKIYVSKEIPERTYRPGYYGIDVCIIGFDCSDPNLAFILVDAIPKEIWKVDMVSGHSSMLWTYETEYDGLSRLIEDSQDGFGDSFPVIQGDRIMMIFFDDMESYILVELDVKTLEKFEVTQKELKSIKTIKGHQIFIDTYNNSHYLLESKPNSDRRIFWEYIPEKKEDHGKSTYEFNDDDLFIPQVTGSTSIGSYRWRGLPGVIVFEDVVGKFKWKSQWDERKNVQPSYWEAASNNREIYVVGYVPIQGSQSFWNVTVIKYVGLPRILPRKMDVRFHFH
jgi:hypothetical protein